MRKNIKKLVYTALFLALLIGFQALSQSFGQLVTGALVNFTLITAILFAGPVGGAAVAIISPFFAFLLGIGPQFPVLLPVIALGNLTLVLIWWLFKRLFAKKSGKGYVAARFVLSGLCAAGVKCGVLYLGIVQLILPTLVSNMAPAQAQKVSATLSASFGVTQLFTALLGAALALAVVPAVQFAVDKGKKR